MLEKSNNIDLILESLDGVKRAEAPPFLYIKIKARLTQYNDRKYKQNFFEGLIQLISRPAINIMFLLLTLIVDGMVLKSLFTSSPANSEIIQEEALSNYFEEDFFYDLPESDFVYLFAQK
jgi:hypothetical protein